MKVWLVLEFLPYEGADVVAVLSSKEWAEARAEELRKKDKFYSYDVEEWDVGGE